MTLNTKFSGPFLNKKDLKGSGAVLVTDGKLIELEMLKGIWKILFSGPYNGYYAFQS